MFDPLNFVIDPQKMNDYIAWFVKDPNNRVSQTAPGNTILELAVDAVSLCRSIKNTDDFWVHIGEENSLLVIIAFKSVYNENRIGELVYDWQNKYFRHGIEFKRLERRIAAENIGEAAVIAIAAIEFAEVDKR